MSMVNYLIPVWALVLGIYLLDESINFAIIIGLAFIFIVAIQLIIGGLADAGIVNINDAFKQYF